MTAQLFEEVLTDVNRKMVKEGRNIVLLIDNAPSHPKDLHFSNIKLIFLPANTTSVLQPLDQGIIMAIKRHYRKRQLRFLLAQIDGGKDLSATQLAKLITPYMAIKWLAQSVKEVSRSTIQKCFAKCGISAETLGLSAPSANPNEVYDDEDDLPLSQLIATTSARLQLPDAVTPQQFLQMDSEAPTTEDFSEGWEERLTSPAPEVEDVEEEEDPLECPESPVKMISTAEALKMLRSVEHLCLSKDKVKGSTLEHLSHIISDLEELSCSGALAVQKPITHFFFKS